MLKSYPKKWGTIESVKLKKTVWQGYPFKFDLSGFVESFPCGRLKLYLSHFKQYVNMDKYYGPLAVVLVISLLMFPYIWKGQDVQVNVVDNLDSNVVWYKMLKDQGKFYSGPEVLVEGFVMETPRFSYPSGLNMEAVLYFWLPPFTAFWINKLIITISAFLGMVLLFSAHLKIRKWEIVTLGLLWATLAYNPHIGISVAGLPLVFWSFFNLKENKYLFPSFFTIIFYSFYSSFVLVGIFTLLFLSVFLIYGRIIEGRFSKMAVLGLLIMVSCFLIQEYNLIYFLFFQNDFVSHRKEMDYRFNSFSNQYPWDYIKNGDHNSVFYWWGYVLILAIIVFYFYLSTSGSRNLRNMPREEKVLLLFAIVVSIVPSFISSLFSWERTTNLPGELFPLIHSFNWMRITFPFSFFMFVVLGFGMIYIKISFKKLLVGLFLAINIFVYQFEWRNLINNHLGILEYQIPTYSQYFAENQFDDIKNFLGDDWDKINIGSINLPPAVATFHGFKSIDGYLPLYDLAYKQNFKRIIERELEKDVELLNHFQYWGNKCYLQNATYPDQFDAYKWKNLDAIEQLDFNYNVLKEEFNTEHLFSAVEIHHERLQLLSMFRHQESAWDVYLYKITQ